MPPRLGVFLAIAFWGVSFVATRALVEHVPPVSLIFARAALGSALLVGLLAARRERWWPDRASWPSLALMGFVGVVFHQVLQAYALRLTSAVNTGWLIGLTPVWVAILAAVHLRERFPPRRALGLVLGFVGTLVVVTGGEMSAGFLALPTTRGDLLILLSTLNWAVYSVIGRPTLRALGALRATTGSMLAGLAMLAVPFVATAGWRDFAHLDLAGWAAVLFLGVACSGLGYYFYYAGLDQIPAAQVAAFLYLEPIVTLAAAMLLIGEPVTALTVAGGLVILAGVALVER